MADVIMKGIGDPWGDPGRTGPPQTKRITIFESTPKSPLPSPRSFAARAQFPSLEAFRA
jgi:hypothetical protein